MMILITDFLIFFSRWNEIKPTHRAQKSKNVNKNDKPSSGFSSKKTGTLDSERISSHFLFYLTKTLTTSF